MSSEGRSRGGVSEQDSRSDQTYEDGAADGRGAARMTPVNVPDRMNELTDGTVRSVDAATGAETGPNRESRFQSKPGARPGPCGLVMCPLLCSVGSASAAWLR